MKVLIVGGTGTIGKAVKKELAQQHTVITAAPDDADVFVDITDPKSIEALYQSLDAIDAVVAATGKVVFAPLSQMTMKQYEKGLKDKLMGQVNLVLLGLLFISDGGSFTLTSGILNHDPIYQGSSAAMVNGAIDGFVTSAAIEMPRGIRINSVSPTIITESMDKYSDYFMGFESVPAAQVARVYSKSVNGRHTGQVYRTGYCL